MRLLAPVIIALFLAGTAGAGPGNGPILFLAGDQNAPFHLYSIRADGSQRTQLTQFSPVNPVLSPDGTKIAFFLTDGGSPRDLYVMNSDGSAPRQLRSYPEYENSGGLRYVTWSPDGSRLAYLLPQFVTGEQLRVIDVNSGADVPVPSDGMQKAELAWSPDGTELAFAYGGVHVKNLATGAVRTLVSAATHYPKWSPDGNAIAYVADGRVWIVARAGGTPREISRPVLSPQAYVSPPLWSPDGRAVYYSQGVFLGPPFFRGIPTVHSAVFAANADGTGQRQLRPDVLPVAWSPEGDALVVTTRDGIFFTRPDGKCITFVVNGAFAGWRAGGNPPPPFECTDFVARVTAPTLAGRVGATFLVSVTNEGTRPASAVLRQRFSAQGAVTALKYDNQACTFARSGPATILFSCALGTLGPDSRRELQFTVRGPRGLLSAGAEVKTTGRDSDPTSNLTSAYVRMSRCWLLGRDLEADVIHGTARGELICGLGGDDRLFGAGGNDTLEGGYGADVLIGGPGRDRFDGGYGADRVYARDGERDTVDCGRGVDTVIADRIDIVFRNCERIDT